METVTRDLGVLSEAVRIRILALLEREELGVGELCRVIQLPQSTVSRHLKALQVANWIRRRAEGTNGMFRLDPESVDPVGWQLWEVVRAAWVSSRQHEEDGVRLAAVLTSRSEAQTFFGRRHAEWDTLRRELFGESFLPSGLAALLPDHWTVADLGCGTGPALVELAPVVRRVVGIDREPRMVEAARVRTAELANVEVHHAGLEDLPLDDGEIDAATCMLVLHHVADLVSVLREVRRVLRPDGRLVVIDMIAHDRGDWARAMGHHHLGFDAQALSRRATEAGLETTSLRALAPATEAQGPPLFLAVLRPTDPRRQRAAGLPTLSDDTSLEDRGEGRTDLRPGSGLAAEPRTR